jgi:GT2 family glycosyltransferase
LAAVPPPQLRSTVIVVTWRGRHLIGPCLDALAAQTRPHELIVVDNASTDGTADVLAAHPSAPTVLRLPANTGYAGALAAALPAVHTPFVAWLNDDAAPQPSWLATLESTLDSQPAAAAATSLLVHLDGSVQSAGVRLTAHGYGADTTTVDRVFGFCGGAALLRTEALRAAGGVPSGFFCYYEDVDTAWRLRLTGHDVVVAPAAVAHHRHGVSSGHGSARFHRWNERNRLLTLIRCAPASVTASELARFAAVTVKVTVKKGIRRHQPPALNYRVPLRLGVLAAVAARLPVTIKQRMVIGRAATVTRREVWRGWAGR